MEGDCLFCRIVSGQLPCERVAENELALAINDIHPKAPVHLLILPKLHYHSP
ncbi:MAG: HIT domain-containing protein, partial [Patescibacteria group bacterium]